MKMMMIYLFIFVFALNSDDDEATRQRLDYLRWPVKEAFDISLGALL